MRVGGRSIRTSCASKSPQRIPIATRFGPWGTASSFAAPVLSPRKACWRSPGNESDPGRFGQKDRQRFGGLWRVCRGESPMRATIAAMSLLGLLSTNAFAAEPWEDEIATALGKAGTDMPGGVYRVSLPRTDLKVTLDGIELKPAFALGSWLAFKRHSGGSDVMVMGDLVLTDAEV